MPVLSIAVCLFGAIEVSVGEMPSKPEGSMPRLRGSIAIVGIVGRDFKYPALGAGPGLAGELGVTLTDGLGIVATIGLGTVIVTSAGTLGARLEFDLSRVHLGVGVEFQALGLGIMQSVAFAVGVSGGLAITLWEASAPSATGRQGLDLILRAIPAVTIGGGNSARPPPAFGPPLSITGLLGIGYSWR